MPSKRVLGIDPGFDRIGLAILENENVLYSHCIETDRKATHAERLFQIGEEVREAIGEWRPEMFAIEKLFFNQNTTNALKVAEARGTAIYEAARAGLEICEYSPQAIKLAVTGYGKSSKAQMAGMIGRLVALPPKKMLDDELDAIAVCITHLASRRAI